MTIKCIIAAIFTLAVTGKLTGKTKSTFDKAGYSKGLMYSIALAELVLTVGLFTVFDFYAAVGLLILIAGALFTLARQNALPREYAPSLIAGLLLSALIATMISQG